MLHIGFDQNRPHLRKEMEFRHSDGCNDIIFEF